MRKKIKACESLIIDFAKKENFSPKDTLDNFQTALLNIAGWICKCYGYSNAEYEKFMYDYVDQIKEAVDRRFGHYGRK